MKRAFLWTGLVLIAVCPLRAEPPAPSAQETWDAVYIEGAKAGYFHTTVREVERDGKKLLSCTQDMQLGVKREGNVVTVRVETGDEETADGKVVGVSLTQFAGKDKLTQTGRVEDGQLVVRTSPGDEVRKLPWDDAVIGLAAQERIFADKKAKPGDVFTYLSFEPTIQAATTVRVTVKEPEEVDMLEVKAPGSPGTSSPGGVPPAQRIKKKLLRAEVVPDKVLVGGKPLQLPTMTVWLDADRKVVRSETDQAGLGKFTVFRTTQTAAEEEGAAPALLPDLLIKSLISLDRPIDHPERAKEIVYRITLKGEDDPATAFAQDARQSAEKAEGPTFELHVRALREPRTGVKEEAPGDECLKGTYFLDSGAEKVKALAAEAISDETDSWRKAQRIEKWVHEHMKLSTAVDYVPASRTAEDLRGDCRQNAMLTAAMCRAAKIPARTALGLVYDKDPDSGPVLAFHMWTEVWAKGQWMGIDAVWGEGGVVADHIKITDHVWSDTQTLAPLAAVTRVMGKMKVEVVEVK
ncbi:MAG TPA: transglutaminase-like domain-containing protein [Gemmataceae bacterium]|nr:transglutaminase-like domain-containing protein [Gemmataceae bacterium]